eukprot:SAG31_NODE_130_length_23424_cov_45.648802_4_plen_794_part_00
MELSLSRVDIAQVASTHVNTLKVLPLGKKKLQKVIVGDSDGVIQAINIKKGEAAESFKAAPLSKAVTALSLGSGEKGNNYIFAAAGRTITGYTRKGKKFYELPCQQTEDINGLIVIKDEDRIFASGEFVLTELVQGVEENYYMATDRINCTVMQKVSGIYEAILGCQDRQIRIVRGSALVNEASVEGPVTVVANFDLNNPFDGPLGEQTRVAEMERLQAEVSELDSRLAAASDSESAALEEERQRKSRELESHQANSKKTSREILFGTSNGVIGLMSIADEGLQRVWTIPNVKRLGGINCMATCDITKDGRTDLLVGRDDGTLEIWSCDVGAEPSLVFSRCINESISSVGCGLITNPRCEDVVLTSFSGKVIAFSSASASEPATIESKEGPEKKDKKKEKRADDEEGLGIKKVTDKDVRKLTKELEELKRKVAKEKERYQKSSTELIATQHTTRMKSSFMLDDEDACNAVIVEIETPIDCVILKSNADVSLVDVDTNVAIVSKTTSSETDQKSQLLATYRCQESARQMKLKIRAVEGAHGDITVYVIPHVSPKTCQSVIYHIKPLSLHVRVQDSSVASDGRLCNLLRITGTFTIGQVHSWVCGCLPEVPNRLQGDDVSFAFRSTFLQSILKCSYRKGEAIFYSDNVTTLAILKDYVTNYAITTNTKINIDVDINEEAIAQFLHLVAPLLEFQLDLRKKHEVIEALQELKMQEEDVSFLESEYMSTLQNAGLISAAVKQQPQKLELLHDIIVRCFQDRGRFRGKATSAHIAALRGALQSYDGMGAIVNFFDQNK